MFKKRMLLFAFAAIFTSFAGVPSLAQTEEKIENKAVVYIYSGPVAKPSIGNPHASIYLDGKLIADIGPERYFAVLLSPGMHTFSFKDKKAGGIERDFAAGSTTYLSTGWTEGWTRKPSGLLVVNEDNGRFAVKQRKPLENKYVRDKTVVILDLPKN
ncbi:MAG: hypothetical protein ACKVQJ_02960 [Pyrinomonadaceae bacterium]